jgi:transposase InsO family protein
MKTICQTMEVARSNIVERQKCASQPPRKCRMADDVWLLPMIRALVDERPTYGYRRIHALLNRQFREEGKPAVNHKRVYRIMKQNGLLLTRYKGKRSTRPHDGKVITLKSNLRWCSDAFEVPCWNSEVVRVAFSMDCCDREVMSYVATSGWINAKLVRDLMFQAMEYRYGNVDRLPHKIEWLTDNGKYYLANDTLRFAESINLIPCSTPAYSPESNGMAEAFVKTFKRDYVYVHDRPDALTVLAQLPGWFEDYNEVHPHKGLAMSSPREYIRRYSG